jgi:hypothetical protein
VRTDWLSPAIVCAVLLLGCSPSGVSLYEPPAAEGPGEIRFVETNVDPQADGSAVVQYVVRYGHADAVFCVHQSVHGRGRAACGARLWPWAHFTT